MSKLSHRMMGLCCLLAAVGTQVEASRGDFQVQLRGQTVDEMVISYMEARHIPGLSVAIVQAPYITRVVGYGLADTSTKQLVGTHTMFHLGHMSAAYTAVAVMQLVEAGKIQLSDPVSRWIDHTPAFWGAITVKDLLLHTSGIVCYFDLEGYKYTEAQTIDDIVKDTRAVDLHFQPGTKVEKSATNYALLAAIIEKASGTSYEAYIQQNQFDRIGLKHTALLSTLSDVTNEVSQLKAVGKHTQFLKNPAYVSPTELAVGYEEGDKGQLVESVAIHPKAVFGMGGVVASAEDVSLWDICLAGEILIKDPANRKLLYTALTLSDGTSSPSSVGWEFPGHPGLMHIRGGMPGYTAYLSRFTAPTELLCVTVLANKANVPDLDVLARQIAGAYDAKLATPTDSAATITRQSPYSVSETLSRFSKAIESQGGSVFTTIDHAGAAAKAGQTLNETQVILVGNPSKGTALMQENNGMAIELPLRASAWKDESGQVWLRITDVIELGRLYNIQNETLLHALSTGMTKAAEKATSAY